MGLGFMAIFIWQAVVVRFTGGGATAGAAGPQRRRGAPRQAAAKRRGVDAAAVGAPGNPGLRLQERAPPGLRWL
jgi:hypothetical protein